MSFSSPVASTSKQDPKAPEESLERLLRDEPKPSTSRGYGDPQPGPSTTASQYDLEVFDSGSSCSPEGTRSGDQSPDDISPGWGSTSSLLSRRRNRCIARGLVGPSSRSCSKPSSTKKGDDKGSSSSDSYTDNSSEEEMSVPANQSSLGVMRDQDESDPEDVDIDDVDGSEASNNCERRGLSRWKFIPSTSTHIQKSASTDNTDEIVQDHENYGTHVNEDSLDLPPDVSPEYAPTSSYTHPSLQSYGPLETPDRPESEDSAEDDSGLISASKRKNSDKTGQHQEAEPIVKKKKKSLIPSSILEDRSESKQGSSSSILFKSNSRELPGLSDSHVQTPTRAEDPDEELEIDLQLQQREISSPSFSLTSTTSASSSPITTTFSHAEELSSSSAAIDPLFHNNGEDDELPPPSTEILEWVNFFAKMNHTDKMVAIEQMIQHCHPTQVRHMMTIIEPQFQRDFISLLPKELALYVLSFLDPRDLLRAAQTCRYWRILAEDNLLWREKCKEAGTSDFMEVLNIRRKRSTGLWKSGYMRQHRIEMNWRASPIKPTRVLKGHDDHVITCLQFSDNRIVSGSDDNTLKVWSAVTGKCLKTLVGHTGGVWSSQMDGSTVVSGSTDRTLKVWNADTGECKFTLYGHTSTVRCMHLHENTVVSGSRDATLRMWDITTGQCLHVLLGHVAAVRCVQYDGKIVVSGAYDYMVKVWNPATEECIHSLAGHTNRVYSLQFDGSHVVSGSLDTSIRVWDVETGTCKHALMGHQSLTSGMELRDNILVSGNADSTVKVWDILTGQCLQTLSGPNKHQSAVTCLQFNTKFVITSSDDGTVKLWDVKTGEFIRDLVTLESGGSGGVVWRIRANATKLVCAVGSRNGTEDTKLLVLDFDVQDEK